MKINLQFTVQCSQCFTNDVFNALLMFTDERYFQTKVEDAEAYFEGLGWTRLPSGNWVCASKVHHAKEAAACSI
jgi:hypothetical protein